MINYQTLTLIAVLLLMILFLIYIIIKQRKVIDYDSLTNLISYDSFLRKGEAMLSTARPREYTLLLVDIDAFKYINLLLGTEAANAILRMVPEYLDNCMKSLGMTDYIISRKFADQFVLLYKTLKPSSPEVSPLEFGNGFSKIIKEKLRINVDLRYSVGKVIIDDPKKNILILIGEAHLANKECKSYYNTNLELLNNGTIHRFFAEKDILYRMNQSLLYNSLEIYLQPKYHLASGKIVGAEALVRWIEDGKVVYNPDQFIPIFEKYYFIKELDLYMFEQACKTLSELKAKSKPDILISVNFSRVTLMEENIGTFLLVILNNYDLSPDKIEIEITESALCGDLEHAIRQVNNLKAAGFRLSLDDFGAGQSALTSLNCFDIDAIKFDKKFLTNSLNKANMCIMLKHLIDLMHDFQLTVIAEGVEKKEDADMLKMYGCDIAQGYYFSKPVPKDMFYRLL
ncbi:MAG: EAL domain-containing protein [Candidatus Fimivivens sp.]